MQELRINFPIETPVQQVAADHIADAILAQAGGFTQSEGKGYWKAEDGTLYVEAVRIFDVAVPSVAHAATLLHTVKRIARRAGEQALYFRGPNGEVRIYDLVDELDAAA